MQTLQTLVRNLAVILLLASFLEMLLPNKSMRGFVQLVMGLFVISAILTPITTFLHSPLAMEIPAWSTTTAEDVPVMATEDQGLNAGKNAVQEQYRQILVSQIKSLVLSTARVEAAEVDITFEEKPTSRGLTDQPKISLVKVLLSPDKKEIQSVTPIVIGQGTNTKSTTNNTAEISQKDEELRDTIATFMSISKEAVQIQNLGG